MIAVRVRDDLFEIRPVGPDDVGAALAEYRQCEDFLALGPEATASKEMVVNDITTSQGHGGRFCGIFTAEGDMIGVADYVPRHFEGDPQAAYLSLLMIAAPFQERGIGAAIVEAVEHEILTDAPV